MGEEDGVVNGVRTPAYAHRIATLFVFGLVASMTGMSLEAGALEEDLTAPTEAGRDFEARYGVPVFVGGIPESLWPQTRYAPARREDVPKLLAFLRILDEEWRRYPKGFFRRSGLRGVVLVRRLFHRDLALNGLYDVRRHVMAFDLFRRFHNERALRHGIHHEIFHMIEALSCHAHPRGVAPLHTPGVCRGLGDGEWEALNTPGFRYERRRFRTPPKDRPNRFSEVQAGFATPYGTWSVQEDKAEIFACLMVPSQHRLLLQWARKDGILEKKIRAVEREVSTIVPEMDAAFWDRLRNEALRGGRG